MRLPELYLTLDAPDIQDDYAVSYMRPFFEKGSASMIANVETVPALLRLPGLILPVTVNSEEYDNSYVCSPYTACVSYAKEELSKLHFPLLERILRALIEGLSGVLKKARINAVVCVNNWMLSTNLYPALKPADIPAIRDLIVGRYPHHAVMFRSLNSHTNKALIKSFRRNGFILAPSRQVYLFDPALSEYGARHNSKMDARKLETTEYEIAGHDDITEDDYARIVELYNLLYLEKYSRHNPQFTLELIAHWHRNKLLHMQGLRGRDGRLDGVVGCFEQNGITSAPLVGYDTSMPKHLGLYRMLIALVLKRAQDHDMVLNLSSGASGFKLLRGGHGFIEYSAVYIAHLPRPRRFVWRLLAFLLTFLGVPLMKVMKL